jgi:hypothetical protein
MTADPRSVTVVATGCDSHFAISPGLTGAKPAGHAGTVASRDVSTAIKVPPGLV